MQQVGAGRGLRIAAWVLVPVGLVLLVAGFGYPRTHYEGVTVMATSMEPTYSAGDRLVVEKVDADEIRRGDVVLVEVPGRYRGAPVVRRVIGKGGDHVASPDGTRVEVNGTVLDEPYIKRERFPSSSMPRYDVRVPEGWLFVLGDHRENSNDSRYFLDEQSGSVPVAGVRGRVVDEPAVPYALLALGVVGGLLTVTGTGLGIGGYVTGRRARRAGRTDWGAPVWPAA